MQGILFKTWKQKAIRESPLTRLWQTRRLDHLKEINKSPDRWTFTKHGTDFKGNMEFEFRHTDGHGILLGPWFIKPRYQVGSVVYIKETLYRNPYFDEAGYMLDQVPVFINQTIGDCLKWRWQKDILGGMFMPQEAARYFIKITDVRPERLNQITAEDCRAEGIDGRNMLDPYIKNDFRVLWDSINGKPIRSREWTSTYDHAHSGIERKHYIYEPNPNRFEANPWVWRICFNLIEDKR